jgi:hypothetical protein
MGDCSAATWPPAAYIELIMCSASCLKVSTRGRSCAQSRTRTQSIKVLELLSTFLHPKTTNRIHPLDVMGSSHVLATTTLYLETALVTRIVVVSIHVVIAEVVCTLLMLEVVKIVFESSRSVGRVMFTGTRS